MSGRGLHIALSDDELDRLWMIDLDERADYIGNYFEEEKFGTEDACETDKSWAFMHSALNDADPDGPMMIAQAPEGGFFSKLFGRRKKPSFGEARFAIMGHAYVLQSDDYYIGLIEADRIEEVAADLSKISVTEMGRLVRENHVTFQASIAPETASEYAMGWYEDLVTFFQTAARAKKNVIFTVDF